MKTLSRDCYFDKKAEKIEREGLDGIVYNYKNCDKICAVAFKGKSNKPYFNYSFSNEEDRKNEIEKFFKYLQLVKDQKLERQIEKKKRRELAKNSWKVGEILYSSWGYEQTNVYFYQIINVKGCKVTLQEIHGQRVEGSLRHDYDEVKAVKDDFITDSKPFTKIVNNPDRIILNSFSSAKRDNGEGHYRSWGY